MGKIASNLPNDSQPWGRDIESRLERLEALVASNEINNAARDKLTEVNLSKVSELLANTAALRVYQSQLSEGRQYVLIGTQTVDVDTKDLTINFSIDKTRVVSFEYATDFTVVTQYSSSTDLRVNWDISSSLVLDHGDYIDYISVSQEVVDETFTSSNPYSRKELARTHRNFQTQILGPGDYEVTVSVQVNNDSTGGVSTTSTMNFSGDVLSVSIIE